MINSVGIPPRKGLIHRYVAAGYRNVLPMRVVVSQTNIMQRQRLVPNLKPRGTRKLELWAIAIDIATGSQWASSTLTYRTHPLINRRVCALPLVEIANELMQSLGFLFVTPIIRLLRCRWDRTWEKRIQWMRTLRWTMTRITCPVSNQGKCNRYSRSLTKLSWKIPSLVTSLWRLVP